MDISRGLPVKVDILCNECLLVQRLNYLHVPFRCSYCHVVGHLRSACPDLHFGCEDLGSDDSLKGTSSVFPFEQKYRSPSTPIDSLSPSKFISDTFLNSIDDLILPHSKSFFSISSLSSELVVISPSSQPEMTQDLPHPSDSLLPAAVSCSTHVSPSDPVDLPHHSSPKHYPTSLLETPPSSIQEQSLPSLDLLVDFLPLPHLRSPPVHTYPSLSPTASPSFSEPTLKKSLSIFTATTPSSPSTLHLNSIRFANVTIKKKSKGNRVNKVDLSSASPPYIPLSIRIKDVARGNSIRGLRASSPHRDAL